MAEHLVDKKIFPRQVKVGDLLRVYSRKKKPWVAKILPGKNPKYGVNREFIHICEIERTGMSNQIAVYTFEISEPGTYEVDGDEFGSYRHTIKVPT